MKKLMVFSLSTLLLSLVLLAVLLFWLIATEYGFRTGARLLQPLLAPLVIDNPSGSILKGVSADKVCWRASDFRFCAEQASLRLRINPLLRSRIAIDYLHADSLIVDISPPESEQPNQGLPTVSIPYRLFLSDIDIGHTLIRRGEAVLFQSPLRGELAWFETRLALAEVELQIADSAISGEGSLQLTGNYPLDLSGQVLAEKIASAVAWRADGSLVNLNVQASLEEPALALLAQVQLLEENMPFDASLRLLTPRELVTGDSALAVDSLQLAVAGDLLHQQGELEAQLSQSQLGISNLLAGFSLDWPRLLVHPVVENPNGKIKGSCEADVTELSWLCRGEFAELVLDQWVSPGTGLSGQFTGRGEQRDTFHSMVLSIPEFDGALAGEAITGNGEFELLPGGDWQITALRVRTANNSVDVKGRIGSTLDLFANLDLNDLSVIPLEATGELHGSVALIRKPASALTMDVDLQGENLAWRNLAAANVKLAAFIPEAGLPALKLRLLVNGFEVPGLEPSNLDLQGAGSIESHRLQLGIESARQASRLEFNCDGGLENKRWAASCEPFEGRLIHPLSTRPSIVSSQQSLSMAYANNEFYLAPLAIEIDSAVLELTEALRVSGTQASARLRWEQVPFRWLASMYPQVPVARDTDSLAGYLELHSLKPLQASSALESEELLLEWGSDEQQQSLLLTGLHARAELSSDRLSLVGGGKSVHDSSLDLRVVVDDPSGTRKLSGNVRLDVGATDALASLVNAKQHGPGAATVDIQLTGTTLKPGLDGRAELRIADISFEELEQQARELQLAMIFNNNTFDYKGHLHAGAGSIRVNGSGDWQGLDQYQLQSNLQARKLGLQFADRGTVLLDSDLQVHLADKVMGLAGTVDLLNADIQLEQLSSKVIHTSSDTVVTGGPEAGDTSLAREINLRINLGDRARFRGYGADFKLTGQLDLQAKEGRAHEAYGTVSISEGRYRAYGQRLNVRRGKLLFNGPLDNPVLDFEAVRDTTADQVAGIALTGTLQKPVSRLFAEPGMPESDIAYFIVTGKHRSDSSPADATLDTALFALANTGIGAGASSLASRLGVEDFQFSASSSEGTTTANVSGYVTPRLYVRFGTSIGENINTLFLQYGLTKNLVLESVSGLNNSMDLFYLFKID